MQSLPIQTVLTTPPTPHYAVHAILWRTNACRLLFCTSPMPTTLCRSTEIFVAIRGRYALHETRKNIKGNSPNRKMKRKKKEKIKKEKRQLMYITAFVTNGNIETGTGKKMPKCRKMLAEQPFCKRMPPRGKHEKDSRIIDTMSVVSPLERGKCPANTMRKGKSRKSKWTRTENIVYK